MAYRLIDPGSEWRLHRVWFEQSDMADLLATDFRVAAKDTLCRCLDKVLPHKAELFCHLKRRWADLFGATSEILLYDLTSTYFECSPPEGEDALRRHGYSRDKRPDCVQVVIALIVTPEGFPLAYEVLRGNTAEPTTLPRFLQADHVSVHPTPTLLNNSSSHNWACGCPRNRRRESLQTRPARVSGCGEDLADGLREITAFFAAHPLQLRKTASTAYS